MNNEEYVSAVNSGNFPTEKRVPLDPPFVDDRGIIQNLWLGNSGSITLITSVKGSTRARHSHAQDFHGCYIVKGSMKYVEKDKNGNLTEEIFKEGEMVFTPPDVYHEMHFLEDTTFITMNGIVKNHSNYEKSVKRI